MTVVLLAGGSEVVARRLFVETDDSSLPCLVIDDPVKAVTARPNTSCRQKIPESHLVDYHFNDCGHRTLSSCRAPLGDAAGKIVLVGSSLVEGLGVQVDATFGALLPAEIARLTKRKVATYNEGMQWGTPRSVALRLQEVIDAKPSLVLWPVTPFDVQNASLRVPYIPNKQMEDREDGPPVSASEPADSSASAGFAGRVFASYKKRGGVSGMLAAATARAMEPLKQSRAVFAIQHFMYENQHEYVKHYAGNLSDSSYLRPEPKGGMQDMVLFEKYYSQVSAGLRKAGIPLVVVLLPSHSQVALLSGAAGSFPELDPTALAAKVENLVERRGDSYLDILKYFENLPDPGQYFFPVDEHMNESGHALLARFLAKALVADPVYTNSLRKNAVEPSERKAP